MEGQCFSIYVGCRPLKAYPFRHESQLDSLGLGSWDASLRA
jgi:hypothetical protein